MNFYLDTEFIESFHKPFLGKRRHFIDLISIGIVAEDGREYYAVSNEFNPEDADAWVRQNVIAPIELEWYKSLTVFEKTYHFDYSGLSAFKILQKRFGKSNDQIRLEILKFICPYKQASKYAGIGSIDDGVKGCLKDNPPVFYGYYADYDWVLFCSLFGRMVNLPKAFPMYMRDLQQMKDETVDRIKKNRIDGTLGEVVMVDGKHYWEEKPFNKFLDYPKQENEHNALADARWNKQLHYFLHSI